MTPTRKKVASEPHDFIKSTIRTPTPRLVRRLLISIFLASLLCLTIFHNRGITNQVEDRVVRLLSNEQQTKLHDAQLTILQEGLRQCAAIRERPVSVADERRTNPRAGHGTRTYLIKNATLIDGDGQILKGKEILLSNGVIVDIGHNLSEDFDDLKVIHAGGRYVTPGLVDMVSSLNYSSSDRIALPRRRRHVT
jgi:hypothetical protein